MVLLRWPLASYFTDHKRGERYEGPCEADVPEDAVAEYLKRGWEHPEEDEVDMDEPDDAGDDGAGDVDGAVSDDLKDEDGNWQPSRSDLESMSYNRLQSLAAESPDDSINGSAKREEIVDALAPDDDGREETEHVTESEG